MRAFQNYMGVSKTFSERKNIMAKVSQKYAFCTCGRHQMSGSNQWTLPDEMAKKVIQQLRENTPDLCTQATCTYCSGEKKPFKVSKP
jgi:hypothetical protein